MEIKIENVKAAYKAADESTKNVLLALFPDLKNEAPNRPITERIKTVEDACEELGERHPLVDQLRSIENVFGDEDEEHSRHLVAYAKLSVIIAALNEGWTPQYSRGEERCMPLFYLYTKKEVDAMDEDTKDYALIRSDNDATGFVAYSGMLYGSVLVSKSIDPRLALKSEKLAEYVGRKFTDLWADYYYLTPMCNILFG